MAERRRAVFLDRDGVINRKAEEGDYVKRPEELELLPGAGAAIARLRRAGLLVFVVTNQRGVALGRMTEADLAAVTARMTAELGAEGGAPDGVYSCLHDGAEGCECRKPRPGMILRAASEHGLDLARSFMVGDKESDVRAGLAAGCRTVLVGDEPGSGLSAEQSAADLRARDLGEAASLVLDETAGEAGRGPVGSP